MVFWSSERDGDFIFYRNVGENVLLRHESVISLIHDWCSDWFNPGLGMTQVDAQAIYGIYVGMVYFMVIPGGWLADNVLGHQKAVLIRAIIIVWAFHFSDAID